MPTLPPHGSMIAGRAGRRKARRLRWNTERAKEKDGIAVDTIQRSRRVFLRIIKLCLSSTIRSELAFSPDERIVYLPDTRPWA
jgi:hypothetical protein